MTNKDSRRAKFEQVYERIADELVNDLRQQGISEDAISWYRKVHMGFLGVRRIRNAHISA